MPDMKRSIVREPGAEGLSCRCYSLPAAMAADAGLARLPFSLRILAENLLRDAMTASGGDPMPANPKIPGDFDVDHSLIAGVAGFADAGRRQFVAGVS